MSYHQYCNLFPNYIFT